MSDKDSKRSEKKVPSKKRHTKLVPFNSDNPYDGWGFSPPETKKLLGAYVNNLKLIARTDYDRQHKSATTSYNKERAVIQKTKDAEIAKINEKFKPQFDQVDSSYKDLISRLDANLNKDDSKIDIIKTNSFKHGSYKGIRGFIEETGLDSSSIDGLIESGAYEVKGKGVVRALRDMFIYGAVSFAATVAARKFVGGVEEYIQNSDVLVRSALGGLGYTIAGKAFVEWPVSRLSENDGMMLRSPFAYIGAAAGTFLGSLF